MPEAATIEAPPPAAPTSAPTDAGISGFTQFLETSVKSATKEPPAAEPDKTPEPPKETKAETPPTEPQKETPKEPAKTTAKEKPLQEMTSEELDAVMKKAPSKAWKVYEFYKNKTEGKIAEYEAKIKTIGEKPVETAADAKKVEAYEKQIKELQEQNSTHLKTLAELDYSKSPEFRERFTEPLARAYQAAVDEISQLTVAEGETSRQATQNDFDLLLRLPLKEQIVRAKAMFGDMADVFFTRRNEVQRIQNEGRQALAKAQTDAEGNRTKAELKTKEEQNLFDSQLEAESAGLVEKFPHLFGDTDNQESAKAQDEGREFARKAISDLSKMSPADRAAHVSALVHSHGFARRAMVEMKALESEVETLKAELAKYRKTDPGAETTGKAPKMDSAKDLESKGIDGLAATFQRAA